MQFSFYLDLQTRYPSTNTCRWYNIWESILDKAQNFVDSLCRTCPKCESKTTIVCKNCNFLWSSKRWSCGFYPAFLRRHLKLRRLYHWWEFKYSESNVQVSVKLFCVISKPNRPWFNNLLQVKTHIYHFVSIIGGIYLLGHQFHFTMTFVSIGNMLNNLIYFPLDCVSK